MKKILFLELENGEFKTDVFKVIKETEGTVDTRSSDGTKRKFFKSNLEKNKLNYIIDPEDDKTEKIFFLKNKKNEYEKIINKIEETIKGL